MQVTAIVLAAGESKRMGRTKQTLPYGESTIIETIVGALAKSRVRRIVVVLGANEEEVAPLLARRKVERAFNPFPEHGMLSSFQRALLQLDESDDAYLAVLGDQPQIRAEVVDTLMEAAEGSRKGIFVPVYEGRRGHPVLIRALYRREILDLPLSVGLNALIRQNAEEVEEVPVDTPLVLKDIDTPEDYVRALEEQT